MGASSRLNSIASRVSLVVLLLMTALPAIGIPQEADPLVPESHTEQIEQWRKARHDRLASDDGWLTLVGLEWLSEGENRLGTGSSATITMPGGPENWGSLFLTGDELRFVPAPNTHLMIGDEAATEIMLVADKQGEPTVVRSGDLSFYVIFRESYGLRIKDRKAPALQDFGGVPNYEIQSDWKIHARFTPAPAGETIEIANVLGHLNPSPVYGWVDFERDGKTFRLLGLGNEESTSLWFLFADRTSGKETYGAGRFLYSDGLPANGRLVIDFNKAYNPPCAFNEYSTCPLPPQENRLDLAVTAGEKDYHVK